jgi:hypothetical protein
MFYNGLEGQEGLDLPSAGPQLRGNKHSLTGRLPCDMPQACLTSPPYGCLGFESANSYHEKTAQKDGLFVEGHSGIYQDLLNESQGICR